jgi:crossover junction endodeoxyribonuclease RuvC
MIIAGIDPGLTGAFSRFDAATGALIDVIDMPVLELIKTGRTSQTVDPYGVTALLRRDCEHIFIETPQSRPGQSTQSTAKTFVGFGIIIGVIAALDIPMTSVSAQKWKHSLRVPASKDSARLRASELIRGGSMHWPLKKHDGRAEAALIGLWGLRQLNVTAA